MKTAEKNTEPLLQTLLRTIFTTTIISLILILAHAFPGRGLSKPILFGTIWLMIFCIVFGGHWLERFFINYIKFLLPPNRALWYAARIVYWFLSAIPLLLLANWVGNSLTRQNLLPGHWWGFGLFYILIEFLMHAIMHWKLKKSFYNGVY